MNFFGRISRLGKSLRQIGFLPLAYLGLHRLGLWSGLYWVLTPMKTIPTGDSLQEAEGSSSFGSPAFSRLTEATLRDFYNRQPEAADSLLAEAKEILDGKIRLFGGPPRQLELVPPGEPRHWTAWETGYFPSGFDPDIKLIWEPARFGWAFTLARAYVLTDDDHFAGAFWHYFLTFQEANPLNQGPNWSSAQEIALRLIALCLAGKVMAGAPSSTSENLRILQGAIAEHAGRLSLTRLYALAQNNNHLLTESAGLLTAGAFLPEHPSAKKWTKAGWRWSLYALNRQIDPDGTYSQHSNNYHRLMLAAALWVQALGQNQALRFPPDTLKRLAAAALWLEEQVDPTSGQAPNLGSNDGANILPLASCDFDDYRPIVQAASQRFCLKSPFPPGRWDEFALWLEILRQRRIEFVSSAEIHERTLPRPDFRVGPNSLPRKDLEKLPPSPHLILKSANSWASLRAVRFHARPAHADQLHADLWWQGINIACDAGTYRYNAAPPWDNSLSRTRVHNTVVVQDLDQMTRSGKFLWLDWAQAERLPAERYQRDEIIAQHDGYARLGIRHQRRLYLKKVDIWQIDDFILPLTSSRAPIKVCLHWLVRDFPWEFAHGKLQLTTPAGHCTLTVSTDVEDPKSILQKETRQIIRAGKIVLGRGEEEPTQGWFAPTYDVKIPAISYRVTLTAAPPIHLVSEWAFTGLVNEL